MFEARGDRERLPCLEIDADPDHEPCVVLEPLLPRRHVGVNNSRRGKSLD
jgi:hypothetical protein